MGRKTPIKEQKRAWRRRAEARPDEILDAALEEFLANGFDAARIEDIAKRAGLSKGAVYLYFSSKAELLKALVEREIAPVIAQQMRLATAETGNVRTALTHLFERMVPIIAQPRFFSVPRLVLSVAGRFPDIRDHYRSAVVEPARAGLEMLVERGIANGEIRHMNAAAATRLLIGPILFEALWTHVLQGQSAFDEPAQFVKHQTDAMLYGLFGKAGEA